MSRETELRDELQAYLPSSDEEARHRQAMLALLNSGDASLTRAHFGPGHFTASCFIVDSDARLLLHHHRRLNRWLQMGGHIEGDESPSLAALREGREESGLADLTLDPPGIFDLDVHPIPAGKGEPDHDHFDVRYLAHTKDPEALILDAAESNDLAWVTLDRARALMPGPESHRVLQKIDRHLRERSLP